MFRRYQQGRTTVCIAILIASTALFGCAASQSGINETLDSLTSVTITTSNTPLVMYRDEPSRAAYARKYLHVGPVQINRSGDYQYYLWVGIWNTMHTSDPAEIRDGFDSIVLFVDGELLLLDASGWTPEAIGASEHAYLKPVASSADVYYRVTMDQIRLIAQSDDIRLQTTASLPIEFEMWDRQTAAKDSINSFLDYVLVRF